jgi:hypothetical protein
MDEKQFEKYLKSQGLIYAKLDAILDFMITEEAVKPSLAEINDYQSTADRLGQFYELLEDK